MGKCSAEKMMISGVKYSVAVVNKKYVNITMTHVQAVMEGTWSLGLLLTCSREGKKDRNDLGEELGDRMGEVDPTPFEPLLTE